MKLWALKSFVERITSMTRLQFVKRVDDNIFCIKFDDRSYIFDLRKGQSLIYPEPKGLVKAKHYNAPFDNQLHHRFGKSIIESITLYKGDKILKIDVLKSGKYKAERSTLLFEFTGKFTNAIITDEAGIITEALRHIDHRVSSRPILINLPYHSPPQNLFAHSMTESVPDIEAWLEAQYQRQANIELEGLKKQYRARIEKRLKKLRIERAKLPTIKALQTRSKEAYEEGNLLLANLYQIKPYDKQITLTDFEGHERTISLDGNKPINRTIDQRFNQGKKLAVKAERIHIEYTNLEERITFNERFLDVIDAACSRYELQLLFPKKERDKKRVVNLPYEVFMIEGERVLLGKNSRGNSELLQLAKASDIWMHLKDRPSCHILIPTRKKELPSSLLYEAAKLCVRFSLAKETHVPVDYTARRNVKIKSGAKVEYVDYKTLYV